MKTTKPYSDKPINQKTYRFLTKELMVNKTVTLPKDVVARIHKFACAEKCSFNKALERILNSAECMQKAPPTTMDWMRNKPQASEHKAYSTFDLLRGKKPSRRSTKNQKIEP